MSLVLLFLLGCFVTSSFPVPMEYYPTKYDHIDVEAILNIKRMVHHYTDCLLSKGPCTPDGLELKRILPDALKTNCIRCTEKQKIVTLRTIRRLKKEYSKVWKQLQAHWDPEDKYVKLFEETYYDSWKEPASRTSIQVNKSFGDIETTNGISSAEKTILKAIPPRTAPLSLSPMPTPSPESVNQIDELLKPVKKISTISIIVASASTRSYPSTNSYKTITKLPLVTTEIIPTFIEINLVKSNLIPDLRSSIQATVDKSSELVGKIFSTIGNFGMKIVDVSVELTEKIVENIGKVISRK